MPISIDVISIEQRDKILSLDEGHFLDLKSIDISPGKLTRHISAFANADGGELYIGIDENKETASRSWRGFMNQEDANGHLQCLEQLFPLGQYFDYTFLKCEKALGLLLKVEIRKTPSIINASDGTPYLRRGAQSLPQETVEQIERLRIDKGITSFETNTVDADIDSICNSCVTIAFMLQIIPAAEPEPWLKKQVLIRNNKPTVAGVLLFSDEPQALLPKRSGIKIYRYKTSGSEGIRETLAFDPISIEGCLCDQIRESVKKTVEIVENVNILGPKGFENAKYPFDTLHEIITNAVLHRDYSLVDDIHIRIFDNRIEVQSPGTLPGHITVDNILDERFSRNGSIVRLINKFPNPPNKDVGEGLNTAFEAMRKLRLKDPIVLQKGNSVVVFIKHEPLASPEDIIIEFLESNQSINNRKVREICHIGSENVVKKVFERLIDKDMIERIPGLNGRATAYRKKSL